jgi:thiol-disulfide isomerase/thioredoxin
MEKKSEPGGSDGNAIAPGNGAASRLDAPARVPSCSLVGNKLYNFALNDLQGQPWELKKQRRGKVILLDFWATNCVYCIPLIPHLNILQQKYGGDGLEVVGIACEQYGSPQDQAQRVASFARLKNINYQLLLSSGKQCPVAGQFAVNYLPTLVLIDESGRIVRRHSGELDSRALDDLDWTIRSLLRVR